MTIVPLAKVSIFGLAADQHAVLEGLQAIGCMHLIPLGDQDGAADFTSPQLAGQAREALRYLMDVRQRRYQLRADPTFQLEHVVEKALANRARKRAAEDRILTLRQYLDELLPWGNFRLPDLGDLAGQRLWFYRVPHPKNGVFLQALETLTMPWQLIHASPRNGYFVVIAEQEPDQSLLPVQRSHVGSVSPQDLRAELDQAHVDFDDIEAEHEAFSRWIFLLSKHLAQADDREALKQAGDKTADRGSVFQVQGWMPRRDLPLLESFVSRMGLASWAESPTSEDVPPTLMTNPDLLIGGEDLVTFYETPGYRDWDPSTVVFFSFAMFFAMILADAGYALVLGVLLAVSWKGMGRTPSSRHFRVLAAVGLFFALLYGVLAGSYFGVAPPATTVLAHLKVLNLNDYDEMMKISLLVGALHLILANGIVAFRAVSIAERARPVGWIAIILAGLSLYLGANSAVGRDLGIGLGSGGFLTILLLSSERPLDSPGDLLLRLFDGLASLANLSKLFGDVMSYLRLFALGLASASLAVTFNQLAGQVYRSDVPLGVAIALLILLLGHGINLLLAIISGFVHGLRLNFIEFFNWSLDEEGYPFEPFIKRETAS
ncbi:V-type ATP synthase subunit I [Cyanobium gracile]|uniref:V-type ATPase 116kDa subunit family protein n=1 Tax=Cyanobium gracile UHCC 0281 TaxID=3110309 RepID=A0ABU5SYY2_9CYAN|nr:V-type ATPase 116kDa subunit family protein [Cyanobium gracile]MEA5443540.1 V-type ATPase 116kDa subunit family protein [Cyanobium gracile UHCC 0281]